MRLVLCSHSPWLGSAERCLLELAAALRGRAAVHVVLPGDGPLRDHLQAAGAGVSIVPSTWWAADPPDEPSMPRGVGPIARELARLRPDAVVSNTIVHGAGALAARRAGLPHLWWVHEHGRDDHGYAFALGWEATRDALFDLSDAVLTSSAVVARELGRPTVHVPYAVDVPARWAPRPQGDPFRAVLVGRVRESKGQQDAVAAVGQVDGAVLDVVGDGDLSLVAGRERVRVHGRLDDPTPVVDAADVALMCSRHEAFGRVTVEAMKRGLPVVGAAAGGTLDLIDDGVTGRLYPAGDAGALAAVLRELRDDPRQRRRLAAAGHAFAVRTFTPDACADAVLDAASRVLRAPRPAVAA